MGLLDFLFGKKHKQAASTDGAVEVELAKHCFVLLKQMSTPTQELIDSAVKSIYGPTHKAEYKGEEATKIISVTDPLGDDVGLIALMPAPVPDHEAEKNAAMNMLWPTSGEDLDGYQAHLIVTTAHLKFEETTPQEACVNLSRLALFAAEVYNGIGVYWGPSCAVHKIDVFRSMLSDPEYSGDYTLPIPIWIGFFPRQEEDGTISAYTLGMKQFGLMDFEASHSTFPLGELYSFMTNLCSYLIDNGPVIRDGDTVGGDENERIKVRYKPSSHDPEVNVYKILFE